MIVSKFGFGLLWLALAQSMPPSPAPTRDESKQALENHKKAVPRLPMPLSLQNSAGIIAKVNNGRFRTRCWASGTRFSCGHTCPPNRSGLLPRQHLQGETFLDLFARQ